MTIAIFLKNDFRAFKKHLLYLIGFAVFYGVEVLFLNSEAFTGYGQYRPLVFLPALVSVAFGPLSGAFVAGFGNLIYDFINKLIIQGKPLHIGHLIGFMGNFIGGYVVGLLATDIDVKGKGLISRSSLIDYVWNTLASILGLGAVTGFIIGFGSFVVGRVGTVGEALIFAGTITVWNSIFMLTLLLVLPVYGYLEKISIERKEKALRELSKIKIEKPSRGGYVDLTHAEFVDQIPVEKEWALVKLRFKNMHEGDMRYKVELLSADIVKPSYLYTKQLGENEEDEVTFSLYPLDKGERQIKLRVIPWGIKVDEARNLAAEAKWVELRLTYRAKPEESEKLSALSSIIGILVILGLLTKAIYDLINTKAISFGLTVALSLFIAEIAVIVAWYIYKRISLTK